MKPTHVLNAAGVTGRPNVDWCESHKVGAIPRFLFSCQLHRHVVSFQIYDDKSVNKEE